MNKITFIVAGAVALFSFGAQAQDATSRSGKIATCKNTKASKISATVKGDFLNNRLPNWSKDKSILGTSSPVVWITPSNIAHQNTLWTIMMTVRGSRSEKMYQVNIDCQSGYITYSQPQ